MESLRSEILGRLHKHLDELPVLPTVLVSLLQSNPDGDDYFERVERYVSSDPAFAARLVRYANSPVSAPVRPIAKVHEALSRLGASLAVELTGRFDELWAARREQGLPSYCRMPGRSDRTLDLNRPVEQADRVLRTFTPGSILIHCEGREWVVFDAVCWPEEHAYAPGSLVARAGRQRLLATPDGFVLLRSAMPAGAARLRFAAARFTRFLR